MREGWRRREKGWGKSGNWRGRRGDEMEAWSGGGGGWWRCVDPMVGMVMAED